MSESTTQESNPHLHRRGRKIPLTVQKQAVKWAKDEISTAELQKMFGQKFVTNTIYQAGVALREAVRSGLLK